MAEAGTSVLIALIPVQANSGLRPRASAAGSGHGEGAATRSQNAGVFEASARPQQRVKGVLYTARKRSLPAALIVHCNAGLLHVVAGYS
jgi:hypothetical protein